jgi:signal transduction histidine kinase
MDLNRMARRSLRRSLALGVAMFTIAVAVTVALHGYWVNEKAEEAVWASMLRTEMDFFKERRAADPTYAWPSSDILSLNPQARALPPFRGLPEGLHDEVAYNGRSYVVFVDGRGADALVLSLDITEQEQNERTLGLSLAASVLGVVALLAALVYWGAGRLLRPLSALSVAISRLPPDGRGTPIATAPGDPEEIAVVATALNRYMRSIQAFMDRELAFINLASHELRSPIAVVRGSMEVALGRTDVSPGMRPHLIRAERAAQGMEDLAELLLALARNPERALRDLQPVDVHGELPGIVSDYAFIAQEKELQLVLDVAPDVRISAPPQILRAVLGNLLRNAIENSDRGTVRVHSEGATTIVVEDSGHGMTDTEMAMLYARIIRSGYTSSAGIGLSLIARICDHFGWRLQLASSPSRGTRASVDFAPPRDG